MAVTMCMFLLTTVLLDQFKNNMERRRLLERLLLHDLLNLTGSLRGFAELLQDGTVPDKKNICRFLGEITERIIDEIETQLVIGAAENGDLRLELEPLYNMPFQEPLAAIYRHHKCAEQRTLIVVETLKAFMLESDPELLSRTLAQPDQKRVGSDAELRD